MRLYKIQLFCTAENISTNWATCFALTRSCLVFVTFETMMMVNVVCKSHYYCYCKWHTNKHWEFNRNFIAFVHFCLWEKSQSDDIFQFFLYELKKKRATILDRYTVVSSKLLKIHVSLWSLIWWYFGIKNVT